MPLSATWSDILTTIGTDGFIASTVAQSAKMNQGVLQNLLWLKGRPYATAQNFSSSIFTTTSTTFVDTGITTGSLATTGGRVLVTCFGVTSSAVSNAQRHLTLYEDGANKGDATYGMIFANNYTSAVDTHVPFCIAYITPTAPTAAAHEWKLYMRNNVSANSIVLRMAHIWALEIGA